MKSTIWGAIAAYFAKPDSPEWKGTHMAAVAGEIPSYRHQTRRLEKSRRRMREASRRANRS